MKHENKLIIIGLFLFFVFSLSAVCAEENITEIPKMEEDSVSEEISTNEVIGVSQQAEDTISADNDDSTLGTTYRYTKISVDSANVKYGEKITFKAHVQFTSGSDMVPGKVTFSQGSDSYTVNLDKSGYATLTLSKLYTPANYQWTAKYNSYLDKSSDCLYRESTANFKLNVQGSAIIYHKQHNSYYNSDAYYQFRVVNKYDNSTVPNYNIRLDFYNDPDNYVTTYAKTDESGIYKYAINSTPGTYKLVVSTDNDNYPSHEFTVNVTVKKTPVYFVANDIISKVTSTNKLTVNVKDIYGKNVDEGKIIFSINGKNYESNVKGGVAAYTLNPLRAGTYAVNAIFVSDNYVENSVPFSLIVKKLSIKISANKWISTTKQYATLKATVKNSNGRNINEGNVKFTIDGKSYWVKVKNGVATKKIKLKKAKNYSYKATFSADKYDTKSSSSKVIVKKAKKWYKYKYGKLVGKISYKQYTKLLQAYNAGKYKEITVKTGKYSTYKFPEYKNKKVTVKKWKYKNILYREIYWYDDFSGYDVYDDYKKDAYYWNHGWKLYGTFSKTYDDGHYEKHYSKYKKKVKTTVTKKVKTGYKKFKYPIRMVILSTEGHNGFSIEFYDNYEGYLGGGLKNII